MKFNLQQPNGLDALFKSTGSQFVWKPDLNLPIISKDDRSGQIGTAIHQNINLEDE